jgi:tetratricopeptide (TPR) repeat protein
MGASRANLPGVASGGGPASLPVYEVCGSRGGCLDAAAARGEDRRRPRLAPPGRVFLMENHDQAYEVWRSLGVRHRVLVHLDAHDDVVWAPSRKALHIANFISLALQDGLVEEVFWVVPDRTWENSKSIKYIVQRLKKVLQKYPEHPCHIKVEKDRISATILGKMYHVCPWDYLPQLGERVLLDIDVDYLVTPKAIGAGDLHRMLPWCWPAELVARLEGHGLASEAVTIAYSVEGGYTPVQWKYLGDELALRLEGADDTHPILRGMGHLRQAAQAAFRGDLAEAVAGYQKAGDLLPNSAAPDYHLARLYAEVGREREAQEHYQEALARDPSYRTAYNSGGIWYYSDRRYAQAYREHRRTLIMNPEDACAHLGMGQLAARKKRWSEAETWLRKALVLDGQLVDAHRTLGKVLARQGRRQEAIAAYEESLRLTLKGCKPLEAPILTYTEPRSFADPSHFKVYAILGKLYSLQGEIADAIINLRMAIAGKWDSAWVRSRLGRLYLKQGQWLEAAREFGGAVRVAPRDLWQASRWSWRRLRQFTKLNIPFLQR